MDQPLANQEPANREARHPWPTQSLRSIGVSYYQVCLLAAARHSSTDG